jgi:hypothetical protein
MHFINLLVEKGIYKSERYEPVKAQLTRDISEPKILSKSDTGSPILYEDVNRSDGYFNQYG